ncbi:MAG: hypothetical protein Q9162_001696 [Coniocarpon cinnabarinum]
MALAGFLTFGSRTDGNVLNNFPTPADMPASYILMVNIARLCFGLNMITTLPLECFVCREVMTNFYFSHEPGFNLARHFIFTTALVCTAAFLALLTCDLGVVFELIGATSACALAYILPPLCYVTLIRRAQKRERRMGGGKEGRFWLRREVLAACAVMGFGGVVMVISLFGGVGKMVRGSGGARVCGVG